MRGGSGAFLFHTVIRAASATRTDWQKAGIPGETVLNMIEKGLIVDHPFDRLALTRRGRAVLKAMLPEL